MSSFTQVFGGTTIYPSQCSYIAYTLTADLTLEWPLDAATGADIVAQIVDIETSGTHTITMPDAQQASNGQTVLFNNLGPDDVDIVKAGGGALLSLAAGEVWQAYLTDNSTEAGSWRVFQYGASTAQAQASALAGDGLVAVGSVLAQATDVSTINTTPYTLLSTDRASAFVWIGALGTFDLPAAADVGNNWFVNVRNGGTGNLTIDPSGAETINDAATLTLLPGDSAVVVTDGSEWWTIGLGKQSIFTFDFTSIDLTGVSGTYTLSGAELNRIAYEFTGALAGNTTVVVPPTTQQYWVTNSATGFTLSLKVSGSGSSLNIASGDKSIYYSNGSDMVLAVTTSGIATPISIADGGTNATSAAGARSNLGAAASGTNADITRMTGLGNGTVSAPAISFSGSTNTGLYRPAANQIGLAINGDLAMFMAQGSGNVLIGDDAGDIVSSATAAVTAIGSSAFAKGTSATNVVAVGTLAGFEATGSNGVFVGYNTCGTSPNSGSNNTVVGASANITGAGANNTLIGASAGSISTGSNNTLLGYQASPSAATVSNTVTLGNSSITTLRCQVTTITALSDGRDKTAIYSLKPGMDFIAALRPVEFKWRMRDGGKWDEPDIGFIAQELLAAQDKTGHRIPHLVDETNPDRLEAGYGALIPVMVRALQQLDDLAGTLAARVKDLEGTVARLEAQLG